MSLHGTLFDAAYKCGYSILSKLPEDKAIQYGQWCLKNLPLVLLPPTIYDPCLERRIGGLLFPNPVILASYYSDPGMWEKAFDLGFGGVTTKTTTINERERCQRRVIRIGNGFVNNEEYPNYGLKKTKERIEKFRKRYSGPGRLIVSIGAMEDFNEYFDLARDLSEDADALEINGSSPNNNIAYRLSTSPYHVDKISYGARENCDKPISWKLSPDYPEYNMRMVIPILIKNGINIVVCSNTRKIDEPAFPGKFGGLSGPQLYSAMLYDVMNISTEFRDQIDVIACGGINSVERATNVLNYCKGVEMLSGFIHDLGLPRKINESELEKVRHHRS